MSASEATDQQYLGWIIDADVPSRDGRRGAVRSGVLGSTAALPLDDVVVLDGLPYELDGDEEL